MKENNQIVAGATENTEDKKFEEIEREVKGTLEVIRQEVQEKTQEIEDKEYYKNYHRYRHNYFKCKRIYFEVLHKADKAKQIQINSNWKNIQELLRETHLAYLKAIRTKVDFCQIIDNEYNKILIEGTINEVFDYLESWIYEDLRESQWYYAT